MNPGVHKGMYSQATPSDRDNGHHQLLSNIHVLCVWQNTALPACIIKLSVSRQHYSDYTSELGQLTTNKVNTCWHFNTTMYMYWTTCLADTQLGALIQTLWCYVKRVLTLASVFFFCSKLDTYESAKEKKEKTLANRRT